MQLIKYALEILSSGVSKIDFKDLQFCVEEDV